MKWLILALAMPLLFSCKKDTARESDCRLSSIHYVGSLGCDTAFITYNDHGEIDHMMEGEQLIRYEYGNGKITGRHYTINGVYNRRDSISYNAAGGIAAIFQWSFAPYFSQNDRIATLFDYEDGKLVSAFSYGTGGSLFTQYTSFRYTGADITAIVNRDSMNRLLDSTALQYSTTNNPFFELGPQAPLYDPEMPFTAPNFHFLALYYSRHTGSTGTRTFAGGIVFPLNIFFYMTGNRLTGFGVSPTDEAAEYNYVGCELN
jgi:hypothetical protein